MFRLSRRLCPSRSQLAVAARRFGSKDGGSATSATPLWFSIGSTTAILAALAAVVSAIKPAKEVVQEAKATANKVLRPLEVVPEHLATAVVKTKFTDSTFVSRPGIEKEIRDAMNTRNSTCYNIVYGAKGVGKSSVVEKVAAGRPGVVKVMVGSADKIENILENIMFAITENKQSLDLPTLRAALEKYIELARMRAIKKNKEEGNDGAPPEGDFIPAIIFEVERGSADNTHKEVLQQVRSLAKSILDICNCIIVVSEANAVLEFGAGDKSRENFIYVDEFTFDEMKQFLKLRHAHYKEEEYKQIYDNIGGNAILLDDFLRDMKKHDNSIDICIKRILADAREDLKAFELKPILKALKENPEGVLPGDFEGQTYDGIKLAEPKKVGDAMKLRNAIVFRVDLMPPLYQIQSTKFKTALKTYEPLINDDVYDRPNTKSRK